MIPFSLVYPFFTLSLSRLPVATLRVYKFSVSPFGLCKNCAHFFFFGLHSCYYCWGEVAQKRGGNKNLRYSGFPVN